MASTSVDGDDQPEWISHIEEDNDDAAGSNGNQESDSAIIEVLKRKVYLGAEGSSMKKIKADPDLDLEFVEVDPAESDWMVGSSSKTTTMTGEMQSNSNIGQWNANDSPETKKEKHLLSLISVMAAKNAMEAAEEGSTLAESVTESLTKNQWQVMLKPHFFKTIKEEDIVNWSGVGCLKDIISPDIGPPYKKGSRKKQLAYAKLMLNPSRTLCVFVQTKVTKGQIQTTYFCNYCKLTESSYGGIYQHLNHHVFTCGTCAYHSSSRLDVEIHREYANHVTTLSQGYLAHRQQEPLVNKCARSPVPDTTLLNWQTVKEETQALIIIGCPFLPDSARQAFKRANTNLGNEETDCSGPVNIVCALPYHRYVSQKSCRKNVLEYHCNFCQSTPIYTQELYRHLDFHSFSCSEKGCDFHSFTNLELYLHRRNCHLECYKEFLDNLVVFLPSVATKEDEFIEMGIGGTFKWSVVLNLPRETVPDSSSVPSKGVVLKKEREWRCKVCNNFVINKGGLTTHLVLLHNVKPKEAHLYMEPML